MGRSHGGLTTKIHALVDANGLPIAIKLTEGQAHGVHRVEPSTPRTFPVILMTSAISKP
jgi:transposase